MKKILLTLLLAIVPAMALVAASPAKHAERCSKADNLIGKYFIDYNGEQSKVRCFKTTSGKYNFQIYWVPEPYDKNGVRYKDEHNPDKSKRNDPADQIVIVWGLVYNAEKKCWDSGKIYDPRNGMVASCTAEFVGDGNTLKIFGNVLGIGKSVYWKVINE